MNPTGKGSSYPRDMSTGEENVVAIQQKSATRHTDKRRHSTGSSNYLTTSSWAKVRAYIDSLPDRSDQSQLISDSVQNTVQEVVESILAPSPPLLSPRMDNTDTDSMVTLSLPGGDQTITNIDIVTMNRSLSEPNLTVQPTENTEHDANLANQVEGDEMMPSYVDIEFGAHFVREIAFSDPRYPNVEVMVAEVPIASQEITVETTTPGTEEETNNLAASTDIALEELERSSVIALMRLTGEVKDFKELDEQASRIFSQSSSPSDTQLSSSNSSTASDADNLRMDHNYSAM